MDDNVAQIKKDLHMFLYHLRLPAEVFVVPLVSRSFQYLCDACCLFVLECLTIICLSLAAIVTASPGGGYGNDLQIWGSFVN